MLTAELRGEIQPLIKQFYAIFKSTSIQ